MPALTQAAREYDKAYEQAEYNQAMKSSLEMQKLQLDLQEKIRETPESKIALAEDMAMRREALRQKQQGIEFGDVAKNAALQEDLSLLEASKRQGAADIENRMLAARGQAIENILMGGKGLVPTATVNMGGVKQQVLPEQVGRTSADIYKQVFTNQTPQLAEGYIARGYDRDTAIKMAAADVQDMLVKERSSGKVTLMSADGLTSRAISDKEAMMMWRDPKTPKVIREQLNQIYGQSEEPQAASWIKTRLGR
jgi:hypothetical protein